MATEAGLQHQGIGKKLLQYALLAEKKLGVQDFVLLATPDGLPLYSKLGFETKEQATAFIVGA
jgi:predicted N-acetyltransferase YhbS